MSDRAYGTTRGASGGKGHGQFISYLADIEKDLKKAEKAVLKEAAVHLRAKMVEKARTLFKKRSGHLIKGIQYGMADSRVLVGAGRPARHAHLLELGTKSRKVKKTGRAVGHVKAKPFIMPTFMEEADAVAAILGKKWL